MSEHITAAVDLDDPPLEPPETCVDTFLWRLARAKFEQHRRTPAGECSTCPRWKRCPGTALAKDGLATALGQAVKESPYWIAYGQVMALAQTRVGS